MLVLEVYVLPGPVLPEGVAEDCLGEVRVLCGDCDNNAPLLRRRYLGDT